LTGVLDLCGGLGGCAFAAGAILRLILGSGVTVVEIAVLVPFVVGGLAVSVIPKWRKPRIIFGSFVAVLLAIFFVAAVLNPGIS